MILLFILPAIGLLLVIVPQTIIDGMLSRGPKGVAGKAFAWIFFLFTGSIAATSLFTYMDHGAYLNSAERSGRTSVVEGCLRYFHPMPGNEHGDEAIEINGHIFSYADATVTSAFHNTESHGGPIHPDSRVRLTTVGDNIIRVEVQQKACPAAPEFPAGSARS